MALLKAFKKQAEKKPCPVCGKLVARGLYRSHLNACSLETDDDDCCIIAEVRAEDRRREAAENPITLDDSQDLFGDRDESAVKRTASDDRIPTAIKVEESSGDTDDISHMEQVVKKHEMMEEVQTNEVVEIEDEIKTTAVLEKITRKRPKKSELSGTKRSKASMLEVDSKKRRREVERKSEISRSCRTATSVTIKHSEDEKLESIPDNHGEERDSRNATVIHCDPSTSRETNVEPEENLSEVLENIKSYLNGRKCELSKNVKVPAENENVDDSEKIGSPYYLTLFHKILKRIFYNEGQYSEEQFWGRHLHTLAKFTRLSEESKQLLMRLFLRKRKWLIADKLSYADISSPLKPLFEELAQAELVDSTQSSVLEIEEAVHLLHVPSLKVVAKQFKLDFTKGKSEICRSLLQFATQKNVFGITMEKRVLHKIKEELGSCFRLRKEVLSLFLAFFTLYSPMDMSTTLLFDQPSINLSSQFLFVLLQRGIDRLRFPAPDLPPLINIYTDAEKLFRYVKAKKLEAKIAELMQKGSWAEIVDCARKARTKFQTAYVVHRQFYESLLPHLRRFTDLHVYARCISHGVEALERVRNYGEAVAWLEYLLYDEEFKLILCNARGGWWDRLALNLDAHLKDKDRAMKAIKDGLKDTVVGDKDRLSLQDRGSKLYSKWKGPLGVVLPERVDIKGPVVGKNLGEARINRFLIEKNGVSYECSVEEVALDHYIRKKGFKEGVHAEGMIWHTLFGLLFYDVIFDPNIESVWFSETQMNPADLNNRVFYTHRQDLFELRFKEIEEASFDDLLLEMENTYNSHYGVSNSEIAWDCFADFEQIKRFMVCCPVSALCAVIRRVITDYRNCRSGFPDLTIWNDKKKSLAVVEVKGPGDKLSTKQRLWLNFFESQNIVAHVCHVSARNRRNLE